MTETTQEAHLHELEAARGPGLGARAAPTHGVRQHSMGEGPLARIIEEQTARLPSDVWLWAASGSILASLYLKMQGHRHQALFVGQWAPTFLLLGIYNKMVKQQGSD